MKRALDPLVVGVSETARRLRLAVDREAYLTARRDPRVPILYTGNLDARVCIVGRELGREEVLHGAPLVGSSGRAVRAAVLEAVGEVPSADDPFFERALAHVLLTNSVPYKPRGNRPFSALVREALRPWIERVLVCRFRGDLVIALGQEVFAWFERYAGVAQEKRARRRIRSAGTLRCRIDAPCEEGFASRKLRVCAVPHPSPANALYARQFPTLMARRLRQARLAE